MGKNIFSNLVLRIIFWHGCLKQCVKLGGVWSTSVVHRRKVQGRDVIKQIVLFAPENKVSCLKQSSKMNRLFWRVKFETVVKCHEWYLCQISRTNHAIICLYYYPQKVCNLHM